MYGIPANTSGNKTAKNEKGKKTRKKLEQDMLKLLQAEHKSRNRKTYAAPLPKD